METQEHDRQLRSNAIGLPGLIAQSLGVTGPEISAVIIASVVATQAGSAAPAAFLLAGIGTLCLGLVYARLARKVPHAGGTYSIVRHGLGRDVGFLAGWLVIVVGAVFVPALIIASAFLLQNYFGLVAPGTHFLSDQWVWWALVLAALVIALCYFGVTISARVLLTLTAIGVTALLIFDFAILFQGGAHGVAWSSFNPANAPSFSGLALGVGIAMTAFSGFETAVFLAEEAKAPTRQVPRAVLGAVGLAIVFFLLTTLSIVSGYGASQAAIHWPQESAFAVVSLSSQFLNQQYGEFLLLLLAISSLASALGTANFYTRTLFSWGRDGYLPAAMARTHPRHRTPHLAVGVAAVTTVAFIIVGVAWQGNSANDAATFFSWMLACGATGILPVYVLIGLSGLVEGVRTKAPILHRTLIPILAIIVVGTAEVTEFHPAPQGVLKWAPYTMLGAIVLGILVRLATRGRMQDSETEHVTTRVAEAI
jgi:amino acid transporter